MASKEHVLPVNSVEGQAEGRVPEGAEQRQYANKLGSQPRGRKRVMHSQGACTSPRLHGSMQPEAATERAICRAR